MCPQKNIVQFVDACTIGSLTYIFTELIEGYTLHAYYHEARNFMTEVNARRIFRQVCAAVKYLHSHGIVHRDIKSEVSERF